MPTTSPTSDNSSSTESSASADVYKILLVFEPSRASSLEELQSGNYVTWIHGTIGGLSSLMSHEEYAELEHDPATEGFWFRDNDGGTFINEMVAFACRLRKHPRLDVVLMHWNEFRDRLLDYDLQPENYHCVFGGMDLSVDLDAEELGLMSRQDDFMSALHMLSCKVTMWPPIHEALLAGRQFNVIAELDDVATQVTRTARPTTTLMRPGEALKADHVAKREYSDCGRHLIFGGHAGISWTQLMKKAKATDNKYRWIQQSMAPLLREVGEWRAFMVGRKVIHIIFIEPKPDGEWNYEDVIPRRSYSLFEINEMRRKGIPLTSDTVLNREYGTLQQRIKADNEMHQFLEDTLTGLIELETRASRGLKPSLSLFCRIDFGLIVGDNDQMSYFVNEVDRGHTCAFWSSLGNEHRVGFIADEFSAEFVKWIESATMPR